MSYVLLLSPELVIVNSGHILDIAGIVSARLIGEILQLIPSVLSFIDRAHFGSEGDQIQGKFHWVDHLGLASTYYVRMDTYLDAILYDIHSLYPL